MSMLSEVESMDTLPFVQSQVKKDDSEEPSDGAVAPSIGGVSESPEELRTLRGQGRYFGISESEGGIKEAEPKCNNCSQRGHFKRDCPHVICSYCGIMDDHYSQHCPKAIRCANCNESGHYKTKCPKRWKQVFCSMCNSKKHSRDRCPSIWRVYLLKENRKAEGLKTLPLHCVYCYNCGSKGHFGDDCKQRRSSKVPIEDGSAFSGNNLTSKFKKEYYQNLDHVDYEENGDDGEEFNYNDYEYDNNAYDTDNNYNNKGKHKKQNRKRIFSNFNPPPYQNSGGKNKSSKTNNRNSNRFQNPNSAAPKAHPLDFPRNKNNANKVAKGMHNSRYSKSQPQKARDAKPQHYKQFNSFKFK